MSWFRGISVKTSQSNIVNNIIFNNSALNGGGIFIEGLAESESIEGRYHKDGNYSRQDVGAFLRNRAETQRKFHREKVRMFLTAANKYLGLHSILEYA